MKVDPNRILPLIVPERYKEMIPPNLAELKGYFIKEKQREVKFKNLVASRVITPNEVNRKEGKLF
jgi:hypothetical protein